ncbi:MAG: recombinase family protein [Firmicutes bacterium]|nr:recombinase family protein [Bacillota bacterium]
MQLQQQTQTRPRAVLLYRASSKMQTDSENDIPLQRNILKPWADKQWDFVKEFVEGGVSGYKVSAANRDALIEIKAMAERKEFDVLGIYMSDRLGRIADETPLVVSFLNSHGIKIVSYCEGEISAVNHTDKLLTYIRYWQAEGESLKTAARCRDAAKQNALRGAWYGGSVPFGYHLVSRGTLNYKGRPIFDIEIDPEQSKTVKEIFRLYGKENYGSRMLAQELNDRELLGNNGKLWTSSHLTRFLRHPLYAGVLVLNRKRKVDEKDRVKSPVIPHLQIISTEDWNEVQKKIDANRGNQRPPTRFGKLLLTGFTFCGQCGEKITSITSIHNTKAGNPNEIDHKKHKYRCRRYYTPVTARPRCETSSWRSGDIDDLVIQDAKEFLLSTDKEALATSHETEVRLRLEEATARHSKASQEVDKKEREVAKIKEEVVKALVGDSTFSQDTLSQILITKERELLEANRMLDVAQEEVFQIDTELNMYAIIKEEAAGWAERFDEASTADKKSMLINIIDSITLYKDAIEIKYKVELKSENKVSTIAPDCVSVSEELAQTPHFFTQNMQKASTTQRESRRSGKFL